MLVGLLLPHYMRVLSESLPNVSLISLTLGFRMLAKPGTSSLKGCECIFPVLEPAASG